jgi:hypothetical protein
MAASDTPTITIRPAMSADAPALGRLGALLVRAHHDLDPARFVAATPGTERGYASWLGARWRAAPSDDHIAVRRARVAEHHVRGGASHARARARSRTHQAPVPRIAAAARRSGVSCPSVKPS